MNQPVPDQASTATDRLRVLYVEDNDYLREIIGMLLEEEDLDVVSVATGEEGNAAFDSCVYDVMITDVSLPKMSGTELARLVIDRSPQTWVVFSSGYSLDHGMAQFGPRARTLSKPFEIEQLQVLLAEIRADRAQRPAG